MNPPASTSELAALEHMLGGPLPEDLRLVLTRFNGGSLPVGTLLPAGIEPGTIGHAVREYAEAVNEDFLDTELLLPFHRTLEGSLLAFDRSAGPVADTWPVVDYFEDLDEHRLMHRTFDGWCRCCVALWQSDDFDADFSLDTYLRAGKRHVDVEPDVATAHATVAHALKRAGRPRDAMNSYLKAARCVPPLHWCDWEALKLAALLREWDAAFEAGTRLASRAPVSRWSQRETSPGRVAETLAMVLRFGGETAHWVRLLDQLRDQADAEDLAIIAAVREAAEENKLPPEPRPHREESLCPGETDAAAWWARAQQGYLQGALRDEDLLFDPELRRLGQHYDLARLMSTRREF